MKIFCKHILIIIIFLSFVFISEKVKAQVNNGKDTILVYESLNDSIDLLNNMNYFVDSLGYYFFSDISDSVYSENDTSIALVEDDLPDAGIYESWDSLQIHYPKFNFSNKFDPISLKLVTSKSKYIPPVPGRVTSNFGWRRRHYHYGIDLDLNTGDTVVNCFDGVVRLTKRSRSYGNVVVIRHDNGLESLYAHLSNINVFVNQRVNAGDFIGLGGNTGWSRGSHLHLEYRYLGAAINPRDIIDYENKKVKSENFTITKSTFDYMYNISKYKKSFKATKYYKVRKGESLSQIAQKNRTTVAKLKKLNKIKGDKIKPGQNIRLR